MVADEAALDKINSIFHRAGGAFTATAECDNPDICSVLPVALPATSMSIEKFGHITGSSREAAMETVETDNLAYASQAHAPRR